MAEGTDLVCHFKNLLTDLIPAKFKTSCRGSLVKIEDCGESDLILLRSGYLKQYNEQKGWHICEEHRSSFGFAFVKHLKQHKTKCLYPDHTGKGIPSKVVSPERSRDLLLKADMIIPCGVKVCPRCSHKITEVLNRFEIVPDEEEKKLSQESDEPTPPKRAKKDTPLYKPRLDTNNYDSDSPSSAHGLLTGIQNPLSQQPSTSGQQIVASRGPPPRSPLTIMLELIQTVDPEFGMDHKKKQFMTQTDETIRKLGKTSRFKMKTTLGKVVKAAISALSKLPEDHGNIWDFLKQSGNVEKELGIGALTDIYIKQIIKAHNRAVNECVKDQMISLVAKHGYRRLRKFNPPKIK